MKAIVVHRFGGPEVLELADLDDPTPGPAEILVRIHAIGVNPVETYVRSGTYAVKPDLPYIPGQDAAGIVQAVGSRVSGVKPGDRVYLTGTVLGRAQGAYASLAVCHPWQVHPLPEHLSFAQGAAIGVPYATAYRALFGKAQARLGETVLVHGASGGVGLAAVQLARTAGLRVIGTAGSAEGLALVAEQGAEHVLDHRQPGYLDRVRELTGGRGADVVVEMLANVNLDRDLDIVAPYGRIVVVGNRGRIEIDPRKAMAKDASVLGMVLWNVATGDLEAIHQALGELFARRALAPVVGRELPLAEAARAHELVLAPGARGKIVLIP
jgi:NADPH2:quinone reductase